MRIYAHLKKVNSQLIGNSDPHRSAGPKDQAAHTATTFTFHPKTPTAETNSENTKTIFTRPKSKVASLAQPSFAKL